MAAISLRISKFSAIKSVQTQTLAAEENFVYCERHKIKLTLKIYHKALEFCDGNFSTTFSQLYIFSRHWTDFATSMESEIGFMFVLFSRICLHFGTRGGMRHCSVSSWIDSTLHNPELQKCFWNSQSTSFAKYKPLPWKQCRNLDAFSNYLPKVNFIADNASKKF